MNMNDNLAPILEVSGAAENAVPESEMVPINGSFTITITKSDLIARLAARFPQLPAKDTDYAVKMILDAMINALRRGRRIEVRGFGSFSLTYRPARVGRNPKSGERVLVPEKWVPHFKTGKGLRERIR